jgi:hypothetical protein
MMEDVGMLKSEVEILSVTRVSELLDYATNYEEIDEKTPGLDEVRRDTIRALKELLSLTRTGSLRCGCVMEDGGG